MLEHANRKSAPKWRDWFGRKPAKSDRTSELRTIMVGERVSAQTFAELGAEKLAAYANSRVLAALDELIEMGAL